MVLAKPRRSPVASSKATSEFTRRSSGRSTPKKPRWLSCGALISSNSAGALVVASPGEKSASRLDDSIVCIDGPVCDWTFTGSTVSNCLLSDCPFAGQPAMSRHATIAGGRNRCSCGRGHSGCRCILDPQFNSFKFGWLFYRSPVCQLRLFFLQYYLLGLDREEDDQPNHDRQ